MVIKIIKRTIPQQVDSLTRERCKIGLEFEKKAMKLLKYHGFTNINLVGDWYSPYDIEAELNNKKCVIEVKGRSTKSKTQTFTFRNTKIKHLEELREKYPVYVLLINKYGHKLLTLGDLLNKKFPDVKFFKYAVYKYKGRKRESGGRKIVLSASVKPKLYDEVIDIWAEKQKQANVTKSEIIEKLLVMGVRAAKGL